MAEIISYWGYIALFVGAILEGESFLATGSILASKGYLNIFWVASASMFGAFTGDQFFYHLGRWRGAWVLERFPRVQRQFQIVMPRIEQHQIKVLLGYRFMYGLRAVTPLAFGCAGLGWGQFLIFSAFGAFLWTLAISTAGYCLRPLLFKFLTHVHQFQLILLLGIVIPLAVVAVYRKKRPRV